MELLKLEGLSLSCDNLSILLLQRQSSYLFLQVFDMLLNVLLLFFERLFFSESILKLGLYYDLFFVEFVFQLLLQHRVLLLQLLDLLDQVLRAIYVG